ncbi:MAG TPA: CTP synthase [Candidatus Dojkabacteria bacterium]|nr:CTP synthase [Candidatus Dojkabacteria bacterium]
MSKFIFVSGGVISGIGKGVTSASIAFIMKSYGYKVTMIKADPYLNVDAGTMNPLEHGETFVLEDGFETDMDIGTYERFTDENFGRKNSMTCGAVLNQVIKDERSLAFEGKWVSMDFHVPDGMVTWIKNVSEETKADITIIEIGGTVGEIANTLFLEANRVMKVKSPSDVIHVHVSYLPVPSNLGEMKTKPVQISVRLLNNAGINPDFIIARSEVGMDEFRASHLAKHCTVNEENVIDAPDVDNIYKIPVNFDEQNLGEKIVKVLGLKREKNELFTAWKSKVDSINIIKKSVKIGVVGKYFQSGKFSLKDSYVSVLEAIRHASWECGVNSEIEWFVADDFENNLDAISKIKNFPGIIIPQGWGSRGVEGKIKAVEIARTNKIPYLGLCFGMQMAVIEYARNVLGLEGANSEEVDPNTKYPVVHIMEYQKQLLEKQQYGGTVRLGAYPCEVKKGSILEELYADGIKNGNSLYNLPTVMERHRHRYEFNNEYREMLEKAGMIISGTSPDGNLVEAIELPKKVHPFFIGTQYHPELKTRFIHPHPIFVGFINQVKKLTN